MMLRFLFAVIGIVLFTQNSFGSSCRRMELGLQDSVEYLAMKKYSPFSYMIGASLTTGVAGFVTLYARKGSDGESELPSLIGLTGITFLSASIMLTMLESGCPPILSDDSRSKNIEMSPGVLKRLKKRRRTFYALHTFNMVPLLLATPNSSHDDRATILAGALVAPFIVDLFMRYTFSRYKVSPWTLSPTFQINEQGTVSMLNLNLRW